MARYQRILLKLSGEALMGQETFGISGPVIQRLVLEIRDIHQLGVEIAIVVGAGNIFRGLRASVEDGMDRGTADHMGMLATVINALALQDGLERMGVPTRVLSALRMDQVAEPFIRRRAIRHMEKHRTVIFAAGTGLPYFSTDTAAALRAIEIHADVLLKATRVDGVFDKDPRQHPDATKFDRIPYLEIINRGLKVMDTTAISLCMDNQLPVIVLNMNVGGNIQRVVEGEKVGTLIGVDGN